VKPLRPEWVMSFRRSPLISPSPMMDAYARPGDNLYTNSAISFNPDIAERPPSVANGAVTTAPTQVPDCSGRTRATCQSRRSHVN
jgi:hypothetical protein